MKFNLKTVVIGLAVIIGIVLYSSLYTWKRACRRLSWSLAGPWGKR
jgi:hypothetical protein